jgi:hypothetical protein
VSGSTGSKKLERPVAEEVPDAADPVAAEPVVPVVLVVEAVVGALETVSEGFVPEVVPVDVPEAATAIDAPPKARLETASAPTTSPVERPRTERRRRGNISLLMSGWSIRRRG